MPAIEEASARVDRAFRAGAVALGAQTEIQTLPGYMPLINNRQMADLFRDNFLSFYGAEDWQESGHKTGSTDMGDIAHIMPALHPNVGGFTGANHANDWAIQDQYLAYILPAKLMAMTVIDLLSDGASTAREIVMRDRPPMTRAEYLEFMRRLVGQEFFDGASVGQTTSVQAGS